MKLVLVKAPKDTKYTPEALSNSLNHLNNTASRYDCEYRFVPTLDFEFLMLDGDDIKDILRISDFTMDDLVEVLKEKEDKI